MTLPAYLIARFQAVGMEEFFEGYPRRGGKYIKKPELQCSSEHMRAKTCLLSFHTTGATSQDVPGLEPQLPAPVTCR